MRRHPMDALSLAAGLAFVVLGALWFAAGEEDFLDQAVWVGPLLLILGGLGLLTGSAERRRAAARRRPVVDEAFVADDVDAIETPSSDG